MTNIFFDVDDTLYDQLQPFKRALEEVSAGAAYDIPYEEIFKRSRYHSDVVFEDVQAGRMSKRDMYIYRIQRAFKDFGISMGEKEALEFQSLYSVYQMEIHLVLEFRLILEWCRHRAGTVGIITNGPAEHQRKKIQKLGLERWIDRDCIFISGEMKLSKPDIRLFRLVQERFDLNPRDTYYVGDSFRNDVEGAKNAGWNAIWFNRRKHVLPEHPAVLPDAVAVEPGELLLMVQRMI